MLNIIDHQGNANQNNKINEMARTKTWTNLKNMSCEISQKEEQIV